MHYQEAITDADANTHQGRWRSLRIWTRSDASAISARSSGN